MRSLSIHALLAHNVAKDTRRIPLYAFAILHEVISLEKRSAGADSNT